MMNNNSLYCNITPYIVNLMPEQNMKIIKEKGASIGELLLGKIPDRQSEYEITVFDALGFAVHNR